jgi:putative hydrolase of the HAD superfamily
MAIDVVLFDLDDVLVDYRHDVRCHTLGGRIGRDADAVHAALFGSGLERRADLGLVDAAGVAAALSATLGVQVTVEDCIEARAASTTARPALLAIVAALATRVRLAILTNNGLLVRDRFAEICPPLASHFADRVHCSAMYGLAKPEPALFAACARALCVAPSRVLFIDDKAGNAAGAAQAGMSAHHYRDTAGLQAALSSHHLLEAIAHGC